MNDAQIRANLFLQISLACFITLLLFGCENPGSVGSDIAGSDTEVEVDSFTVDNIVSDSVVAFSGAKPFVSAGEYEDPLFGNVKATALLKPILPPFRQEIAPTTPMKLRLAMDVDSVYGDTLGQAEFDLFRINELWRGKAWKLNDEVPLVEQIPGFSVAVGSFTVNKEDSIDINLSSSWSSEFIRLYNDESDDRDSLYTHNLFGLAIVPKNKARIIPIPVQDTRFIIEETEDTTLISISQSAYSLERTNPQSADPGTRKVMNTLEKFIGFDMNITEENLGTTKIARAEFVFYVDQNQLDESISQNSLSSVRPRPRIARLHLIRPEDVEAGGLEPGSPIATGNFSEADSAFHFDITSFVRSVVRGGITPGNRFFVTLENNNGLVFSTLLFDDEAPERKKPKLIVTSIKSEG